MAAQDYAYNWNKERNRKLRYDDGKSVYHSLKLKVSDPGKIVFLISSLWDERCPPLERKINKYLTEVTRSDLSFFLHNRLTEHDIMIHVIGEKELSTPLVIPIGGDFSRLLLKAQSPICTDDERFVDPSLLKQLKKYLNNVTTEGFRNILVIPLTTRDCHKPACFYGLVNSSLGIGGLERNKTLVQECFRYCTAIIVNTYASDMEKVHSDMCNNVLRNAALAFTNVDNESALITILQQQTSMIMNAAQSKVYIFKEMREKGGALVLEAAQPPRNTGAPLLTETVLAEFVSTPEIIINKEPSEAFQFSEILKKEKVKTKTMMSFPTFFNGEANGHVEVMNKKSSGGFNKGDEEYAKCLGAINGLAIEAMWKLRETKYQNSTSVSIDCVLMRRATIHCEGFNDILYCQDLHSYENLLEFRFRPHDVQETHTLCILMGIFDELDFLRTIRLDERDLLRFLISVKNGYGNLPYHNWYHGFGTAHFVFTLCYRLSLLRQGVLTNIEGFALLVAGLTHDVDYRGCTSQFQLYAGDNMAALYTSAGGIQQRLTLTTVLQLITHPRCNLLSKLDLDEFKTFVNVFQILMMDTNLAYHVNKMGEIYLATFRAYDRNNTRDVRMLLSLFITCADLSDYTKPWSSFVEAHDSQMMEYFRENLRSSDGVFDLYEAVLTPKVQMEVQINFLKCLVLPLFENLYIKYPTTYECHKRAEANLNILEDTMETIDKYPEHTLAELYRAQ